MHDLAVRFDDTRLLDDLRCTPDDDGSRLVWADAIGGERGELVVLQIDLARGGLTARETIARRKRQRLLLANHGAAWSGLEGIARRVSFARGFVDAAEIAAPLLLEYAGEIAYAAPLLTSLTITHLHPELVSRVVADPFVRTMRGLELAAADGVDLRSLRALGVPNLRGPIDPRALLGIERLWLGDAGADAVHALLAAGLPALRSLDLGARCPIAPLARMIPPVMELLGVDDVAALIDTPVAATIERLDLRGDLDPRLLAAFPRLRSLSTASLRALPRAREMPALRELAIDTPLQGDATRALASELGPQLELLDLRNSPAALRFVNELKTKVAGELLVGTVAIGRRTRSGLLRVGRTTQRSWWDHVTLG